MEQPVQSKQLRHFMPECAFSENKYRPGPRTRTDLYSLYLCVTLKGPYKGTCKTVFVQAGSLCVYAFANGGRWMCPLLI